MPNLSLPSPWCLFHAHIGRLDENFIKRVQYLSTEVGTNIQSLVCLVASVARKGALILLSVPSRVLFDETILEVTSKATKRPLARPRPIYKHDGNAFFFLPGLDPLLRGIMADQQEFAHGGRTQRANIKNLFQNTEPYPISLEVKERERETERHKTLKDVFGVPPAKKKFLDNSEKREGGRRASESTDSETLFDREGVCMLDGLLPATQETGKKGSTRFHQTKSSHLFIRTDENICVV